MPTQRDVPFPENLEYGEMAEKAVLKRLQAAGLPALPFTSGGNYGGSADINVGSIFVEVKRRRFNFPNSIFPYDDAMLDGKIAFDEKCARQPIDAVIVVSEDLNDILVFPVSKKRTWHVSRLTKPGYTKDNYHAPLSSAISFDEYVERLKKLLAFDAEVDALLGLL